MTTRVVFDSNLFVSYLLNPEKTTSAVVRLVESISDSRIELLVPQELLEEIAKSVEFKPYLRDRINSADICNLTQTLLDLGEPLPPISDPIPAIVRDRKDDYLLAAAAIANVDVLVTGDHDLLALRDLLPKPRIMTPAEFVELLDNPS